MRRGQTGRAFVLNLTLLFVYAIIIGKSEFMGGWRTIVNYIAIGIQNLKEAVLIGIPAYIIILFLLYLSKIRRKISWKCVFEMIFCIYIITLLKTTGIFTLTYNLDGIYNYNFVPFAGSSIIPVLLNFVLFVPYGLLLPLLFRSCRGNWKKVVIICGLSSLTIELLQMIGGRYAEIDDFLINTFGAFSGYILYTCVVEGKKNRKKAVVSIVSLCAAVIICFACIYAVGDNEKRLPDGLSAAENNIAEINVYSGGEKRTLDNTYVYNVFAIQISNCGGHLLEIQDASASDVWNKADRFIEVIYDSPQAIAFENAENFSIENADRILYNADKNILYWGNSGYQSCLDYTKLDEDLQAHQEEILDGYKQLPTLIDSCFEP